MHGIEQLLYRYRAIHVLSALEALMRDGKLKADPAMILRQALRFMTKSTHVEGVKFGIGLLSYFDIEKYSNIKNILLLLAGYDEFTLFALKSIVRFQNANRLIFELAKGLRGWGKAAAVGQMQADSEEIKEWIFFHGCENDMKDAYMGYVCAVKCDLEQIMRKPQLTFKEFRAASLMMNAMLGENVLVELCQYPNADSLIDHYLKHAQASCITLQELVTVVSLLEYLKDKKRNIKSIRGKRKACRRILLSRNWLEIARVAIPTAETYRELGAIVYIADVMNLDIRQQLFQYIIKDALAFHPFIYYLYKDPFYAGELTAEYEDILPLRQIATGKTVDFHVNSCLEAVLKELRRYPGTGLPIIAASLHSSSAVVRREAAIVLEAWVKTVDLSLKEYSTRFYQMVEETFRVEADLEIKKRLEGLLYS